MLWPSSTGNGVSWKSRMMWRTSFSAALSVRRKLPTTVARAGLVAVVEVDGRLGGGRRRHRLAAEALARLLEQRPDLVLERLDRGARRLALRHLLLRRQLAPGELLGERVGPRHDAPVVDRAGRARRDAVHAVIADRGIDDVVVVVMRDGVDRARLLAGVAPDADLGIDQVLLFEGGVHGCFAERQWRVANGQWNSATSGADLVCPHSHSLSPNRHLTPRSSRIRSRRACCRCRPSGGAIQPANWPGSATGFISASMKSPSAFDGSQASLSLPMPPRRWRRPSARPSRP